MKNSILGKVVVGLGVLLGMSVVALASTTDAEAAQLYRAYNPNTGEHLYTANASEIPFVVRAGWRSEGNAWEAPATGANVYRVFNPNNGGDHHYTLNMNEVNNLKSKGWRYEGISWKSGGSTPVYRLYNPNARSGTHHFTTLASEKNHLVKVGWRYEGIAFYSGNSGNSGGYSSGGNSGSHQLVWTVWFTAAHTEDKKYEIKAGVKTFSSENEAKNWIDNYATKVLVENGVSSPSYGYRQILK